MNYIELNCVLQSNQPELLSAYLITGLGEIGYETFDENEFIVKAYIPETNFSTENIRTLIDEIPKEFGFVSWTFAQIEQKNWNAEWEKHFNPVVVFNTVLIRASFHQNLPSFPYEILIDPKMSFGTGHHATTALMIKTMLGIPVQGKAIVDMGCGTGVLAILAHKMGAASITAVDIDEWAISNTKENFSRNGIDNFTLLLGGIEKLEQNKFDILLANINRNILVSDIPTYATALVSGGFMVISGFYHSDLDMIRQVAEQNKLSLKNHIEKNSWIAAIFTKG